MCHKYGLLCLVVHLKGEPSNVGIERLKRVLEVCDKLNVDLAIENLHNIEVFEDIFKNISNSHLKMCYDSGHHNIYYKDREYFPEFNNKLVCLHLHDNFGEKYDHIPFSCDGNINMEKLATTLAKTNIENLDFEILLHKNVLTNIDEVLSKTIENAKYIERIIETERKN